MPPSYKKKVYIIRLFSNKYDDVAEKISEQFGDDFEITTIKADLDKKDQAIKAINLNEQSTIFILCNPETRIDTYTEWAKVTQHSSNVVFVFWSELYAPHELKDVPLSIDSLESYYANKGEPRPSTLILHPGYYSDVLKFTVRPSNPDKVFIIRPHVKNDNLNIAENKIRKTLYNDYGIDVFTIWPENRNIVLKKIDPNQRPFIFILCKADSNLESLECWQDVIAQSANFAYIIIPATNPSQQNLIPLFQEQVKKKGMPGNFLLLEDDHFSEKVQEITKTSLSNEDRGKIDPVYNERILLRTAFVKTEIEKIRNEITRISKTTYGSPELRQSKIKALSDLFLLIANHDKDDIDLLNEINKWKATPSGHQNKSNYQLISTERRRISALFSTIFHLRPTSQKLVDNFEIAIIQHQGTLNKLRNK